jgi:hypothetical protein
MMSDYTLCDKHFLDSGAFTLQTMARKWCAKKGKKLEEYYSTPEFYFYMDAYAEFIKRYSYGIDFYANLDVIPDPVLSHRNMVYLQEKHGLNPVPVVHCGTSTKWIKRYVKTHKYIGLGGLVGKMNRRKRQAWLDEAFNIICDQPSRLPKIDVHGFGISSYAHIIRYPWYSVDSSSWTKAGGFGGIFVPHKRNGVFVFDRAPYVLQISNDSASRTMKNHCLNMRHKEKAIIHEWLELIKVPLGTCNEKGECIEQGVTNYHGARKKACILFFEEMRKHLPEYPWPFTVSRASGFGIIK